MSQLDKNTTINNESLRDPEPCHLIGAWGLTSLQK